MKIKRIRIYSKSRDRKKRGTKGRRNQLFAVTDVMSYGKVCDIVKLYKKRQTCDTTLAALIKEECVTNLLKFKNRGISNQSKRVQQKTEKLSRTRGQQSSTVSQ